MPYRTTVAVIVAAAATAQADIVEMSMTGVGEGVPVRLDLGDRTVETFAGQILHEVSAGTGFGESMLGSQAFFCVDPHESTSRSSRTFTITGLTSVPDSVPMSQDAAEAIESMLAHVGLDVFTPSASDADAAAFQLAVWEVISDYDSALGRSSLEMDDGWFSVTGPGQAPLSPAVLAQVDVLFDATATGERFGGSILALRAEGVQDQLHAVMGDRAIPAPGAAVTLSAGVLCFGGWRRRR